MIDHLELEVEVQTELMNIGLVIASIQIPGGDWSPTQWAKLMAKLGEHLDVVDRALTEAHKVLESEGIKLSRSPDIISVCEVEFVVSRSFRISPPTMTKTLLMLAFRSLVEQDDEE